MMPVGEMEFWMGAGTAVAYALSATTLGSWRASESRTLPERLLVGILALSLWPWVLSWLGLVTRGALAAPLILAPFAPWSLLRQKANPRNIFSGEKTPFGRLLATGLLASGMLALVAGSLPPCGMDTLTYHLGLPMQYIMRGSIAPYSSGGYAHYFQTYEFAVMPLLAVDASGTAAGFLNVLLLLASARSLQRLSSRLGATPEAAAVVAAAILSAPILVSAVALTKNDLLALSLTAATADLFFRPGASRLLAALFAGAALAVKPTAAFAVVPLVLVCVHPRNVPGMILPLSLFPLTWMARNFFYEGKLLPDVFWSGAAFVAFTAESASSPFGALHHLVLSFPFRYIDGTDGPLGLLLAALCILAVATAGRRPHGPRGALLLALALAAWSLGGHSQARYLVPALGVAAAFGAGNLGDEARKLSRLLSAVVIPVFAFVIGYNAWHLEAEHGAFSWHAGKIERAGYYERWLDSWPVQDAARTALAADARIIAVGEGELFPMHRIADYDAFWEPCRVLAWAHDLDHDSAALKQELVRRNYTHILDNPVILAQLIGAGRTPVPPCDRDRATLEAVLATLPVAVEVSGCTARIYALR